MGASLRFGGDSQLVRDRLVQDLRRQATFDLTPLMKKVGIALTSS